MHQGWGFRGPFQTLRPAAESWKGGERDTKFRGMFRKTVTAEKGTQSGHLLEIIHPGLQKQKL